MFLMLIDETWFSVFVRRWFKNYPNEKCELSFYRLWIWLFNFFFMCLIRKLWWCRQIQLVRKMSVLAKNTKKKPRKKLMCRRRSYQRCCLRRKFTFTLLIQIAPKIIVSNVCLLTNYLLFHWFLFLAPNVVWWNKKCCLC